MPLSASLQKIRDNVYLNYAVLAAAVVAFCARAVPFGNEYVYLLRLRTTYDSTFLLNDVSFASPAGEHWLFNHVFGLATYLFSFQTIAWTGRIVCWAVLIYALQRLARHWGIPLWMATLAILLWLARGQSVVADEWMIGTFEAKCVAYICLLFALDGFARGLRTYPAILLGLTFSFHPAVGMWSILAVGGAMLFVRSPMRQIVNTAFLTGLFALPGLIALLMLRGGHATADDWRFLELVRFPQLFDPFSWSKTAIVLVYLQLAFCVGLYLKGERRLSEKFLIAFLSGLAIFFTFGVTLRALGSFELMEMMPTRLFPVFAPLFFFWYLAKGFEQKLFAPPVTALAITAFACLVLFLSPIATAGDQFRQTVESWRADHDDVEDCFKWIGANIPNGTIVIAPPWRQDFWWNSRRAQVVSWNFPTYLNLGEWHRRVELLAGDTPRTKEGDTRTEFYYSLPQAQIDSIAAETNAEYLVSNSTYPYAVVFQSGDTRVYRLR